MKKIFAFAMALVSMAAVMTSCSNDEADFIQQTTVENQKQQMMDVNLVVAVTPEQMNYYEDAYTVQTPDGMQTVKVSEMKPATKDEIKALDQAIQLSDAFDEEDAPINLKYYSIKLGKVNSIYSSKIQNRVLEVKANHPTEQFVFMNAACLCFNGRLPREGKTDIRLFKGIYGDDANLKGFANVLTQYSNF